MTTWQKHLADFRLDIAPDPTTQSQFRNANCDMVRDAMVGYGPDASRPNPEAGQRLVYNLSSAHVGSTISGNYLNGYDLETVLGTRRTSRLRRQIDEIVAELAGTGQTPETIYYGAVELNGSGVRYFGDFCLVLKPDPERDDLLLLTNSYDVHRQPVRHQVFFCGDADLTKQRRQDVLKSWSGRWPADAPDMAVLKLAGTIAVTRRRLSIGMVAVNVLVDEDYLEVLRKGTFRAENIEEIRISAADAATEARIADRLRTGPAPSLSELQWRHRRRAAEAAAVAAGLKVRVVFTLGRDRG